MTDQIKINSDHFKRSQFTKIQDTRWSFTPHFENDEMLFITYVTFYHRIEDGCIKGHIIKAPVIYMN